MSVSLGRYDVRRCPADLARHCFLALTGHPAGARFCLEDGMLVDPERGHLLYDRDSSGVHTYTLSFEDRFSFEFVEWRGGYADCGAPNAGVRMAAQARARNDPR